MIWIIFHQVRLRQRDKISKTFILVLMEGDFLTVLGAAHSVSWGIKITFSARWSKFNAGWSRFSVSD
jgi:hypothetical protein